MNVALAKAPCNHLVQLAQAEVAANPQASQVMRQFSRIRVEDAERGVHKLFCEKGYSCPVRVDGVDLGPGKLKKFPYIKLSTWMQHLMDTKRLSRQMVGVSSISKMKSVLKEFWQRQKMIRPNHGVFRLAESGALVLDQAIPFFSHTDEGRSYKHLPLFALSSHGALGRGTRLYLKAGKHRAPLRRNGMGLNFLGKTWSTNFIFTAVLKTVTAENPDVLDQLIKVYAADVEMLMTQGLSTKDGLHQFWFIHLGSKGDLPALQKLAGFKRSFAHVPRGPSSRKACKGVCFLCDAGQEADASAGLAAIPYEDVSPGASWVATCGQNPAWESTPSILAGLPLDVQMQIDFFRTDLWHNAHLGVLKHHVASAWVAIIESDLECLPAGSVDAKFEWVTRLYRSYFTSAPFVTEISRDTLCFPASTASPVGKWSKGQASTEMMHFLDHFCQTHIAGKTRDRLLLAIVPCIDRGRTFFCLLVPHNLEQ